MGFFREVLLKMRNFLIYNSSNRESEINYIDIAVDEHTQLYPENRNH